MNIQLFIERIYRIGTSMNRNSMYWVSMYWVFYESNVRRAHNLLIFRQYAQTMDCVRANYYTIYINFMCVHIIVRNLQIATNIYIWITILGLVIYNLFSLSSIYYLDFCYLYFILNKWICLLSLVLLWMFDTFLVYWK